MADVQGDRPEAARHDDVDRLGPHAGRRRPAAGGGASGAARRGRVQQPRRCLISRKRSEWAERNSDPASSLDAPR